jgi:hypothetical protein
MAAMRISTFLSVSICPLLSITLPSGEPGAIVGEARGGVDKTRRRAGRQPWK